MNYSPAPLECDRIIEDEFFPGYGQDMKIDMSSNGALSPLGNYSSPMHAEVMDVESDYDNPNINPDTINPNWYTSDL